MLSVTISDFTPLHLKGSLVILTLLKCVVALLIGRFFKTGDLTFGSPQPKSGLSWKILL